MSDIAIHVDSLGKQYRIGKREQYSTLRDTITDVASASLRRVVSLMRRSPPDSIEPSTDTIWALQDVSFEIPHGSVVGIIGRNGAGKSTLLKILSRITEPSKGRVEIQGRVGSLLEVATGFHPELTGRENIFLNGAIMGMKKAEISRKFDAIVAFAETDKFVDTPVKHYSSGMYARLAFAVAAHLESDILMVDEVLAVGDASFQKKCLGKMGEAAKTGRTILFVSHQLNQIRRLCDACLWLDGGEVRRLGPTADVATAYESAAHSLSGDPRFGDDERTGARFVDWHLVQPRSERANVLSTMGPFTVSFLLKVNTPVRYATHGIALFAPDRQLMWGTSTAGLHLDTGIHQLTYQLAALPLRPGNYTWLVSLFEDGQPVDVWDCSPELVIATKPRTRARDDWSGLLNLPYKFATHLVGEETARVSIEA